MGTYNLSETTPFIAVHPGEILKDELKERGITQKELSSMMKIPASVVNEIIHGKRNLNADYALAFSKVLSIPAETLMKLQSLYDLDKAKLEEKNVREVEAENELTEYNHCFDVRTVLKRLGGSFSSAAESLLFLKEELRLQSPAQMQIMFDGMFRKSARTGIDHRMVMTWKLLAENAASHISVTSPYDKNRLPELASRLRGIFNENINTLNSLKIIFEEYGIIFGIVEKVDKASVDGYSFICNGHPAIIITKRYDRIDNLAFTVMHELGHVYLHFSSEDSAYIHISENADCSLPEREADAFAQESLIPDEIWRTAPKTAMNIAQIQSSYTRWAKSRGINKWIALGRVSHETGIWKFRQDSQRAIN